MTLYGFMLESFGYYWDHSSRFYVEALGIFRLYFVLLVAVFRIYLAVWVASGGLFVIVIEALRAPGVPKLKDK